jgi:hypothetical protein
MSFDSSSFIKTQEAHMEPLILLRVTNEKSHIVDTLMPVFAVSLIEHKHQDNLNKTELSDEERKEITRVTYSVVVNTINAAEVVTSGIDKETADKLYGGIIEAAVKGEKLYTLHCMKGGTTK